MPPPRGLKTFVVESSPGKLVRGKFPSFRPTNSDGSIRGSPLRGITKRLHSSIYSSGEFPEGVFKGEWRGGAWKGDGGGIRRGRAVDSQVSKLAGVSKAKRASSNKFKLSRMLFSVLEEAGIEPLCGQRVVIDEAARLGTAADVVGYRRRDNKLVLVELKSGYRGDRSAPALSKKKVCSLAHPLSNAKDTILNRHFAQLTATLSMFVSERKTMDTMRKKFDLAGIEAVLVYTDDYQSEIYELPRWWVKRGKALVRILGEDR